MHSISTIGSTFGSKIGSKIGGFASRLFGSSNERRIKGYQPRVEAINALETEVAALSDAELKARTETFRRQLREGTDLEDLLVPAFATVREAAKRTLGQRTVEEDEGGISCHKLPIILKRLHLNQFPLLSLFGLLPME